MLCATSAWPSVLASLSPALHRDCTCCVSASIRSQLASPSLMGWPRFVPEIVRKSRKRGALVGRGCQRPSSTVLQPVSKPFTAPSLPLALEMSLTKPAGHVDPCLKLFGVFNGGVVGRRLDWQGLSVAMPGRVGVVPWVVIGAVQTFVCHFAPWLNSAAKWAGSIP